MKFPIGNGFLENIGARIVFTPNAPVNVEELSCWLLWCVSIEKK